MTSESPFGSRTRAVATHLRILNWAEVLERTLKLCKLLQINRLGKLNPSIRQQNDLAFNGGRLILRGSPQEGTACLGIRI